ncbi:hypothetical protein J40TS1_34460 [Paenibacillus montaniterrae]|uniref:HTH cro/C1-type domain-containing protein n=1 Tax=Paenibacillus montaniterrae TaxID=429341 RepID=A0A919YSZ4_9BACL|nr:helix-turn-helix transcriptional regulator [Paenibacillus montaniterrae]GIP17804.1 hypothetical protein J40TS1_34460 [Paenibacillus montaniterrae]
MKFNLQRLRFERLSRKVSQEDMAQALNINRTSYHKKENGKIKISVEEFATMLEVLNIPQSEAGHFFEQNVPEREQSNVAQFLKTDEEACAEVRGY